MYEFPCDSQITAVVRVGGGSVEIVAEERASATVDVRPFDDSESARETAAHTRVEMHQNRLLVEAPEASGWIFRRSPRLRVDIRLPLDSSVQLKVASADISCHGRYEGVAVNSASGDVYVEQVTGDVSANTASGDVRIVEAGGSVRVNAASGDFAAQAVRGPVVAHSASGDVEIDEAAADIRATTASGNVRIGSTRRGTTRINSASGDVSIGVAAGTGVWLDLTTISGSTRSDLAVSDQPTAGEQHQLNLEVRTMSGDIDVHRVSLPAAA